MKIFYVTLNNANEALAVSNSLLEKRYAICTNWFPITCAYLSQGEIKQGGEVVLIIKTQDGYRKEIERVIAEQINYTNFIAELNIHSVNQAFVDWLNSEVKIK